MKNLKLLSICVVILFSMSAITCALNNQSIEDKKLDDISNDVLQSNESNTTIKLSSTYLGNTYHISSDVNELTINGDYTLTKNILEGFSICIDSRSNDLTINLNNVGFKSLKGQSAIYSIDYSNSAKYKVNLICNDSVIIYGSDSIDSKNYISTIYSANINITLNCDVEIYGGNGTKSSNGLTAISTHNLTVTGNGKLIATGGNGGNGTNGVKANDGYSGSNAIEHNATKSTSGSEGKGGINGSDGGNGAFGILTSDLTVSETSYIYATGGDGGNGGTGGDGGNGGTGGTGVGSIDEYKVSNGGAGGTGGKGGDGGKGGNGGNGISYSNYLGSSSSLTIIDGNGGKGGNGGTGGKGGNGGDGGRAQWFVLKTPICGNGGNGGNGGTGGDGGNGGKGLIPGNGGIGGSGGLGGIGGSKGVVIADISHIQFEGKKGSNGQGGMSGKNGQSGSEVSIPGIYCTVSFISNGGSNVDSQSVLKGSLANIPPTPTHEDTDEYKYSFDGWYLNSNYTQKYSFGTPVVKNITLYAKWISMPHPKYNITFESNGGSPVTSQTVVEGKKALIPNDPEYKDGTYEYIFGGWYFDPNLSYKYNFDTPVTKDITLYAKWDKIGKTYTVTFESNGGSKVDPQIVIEGKKVIKPEDPTKEGGWTYEYSFGEWYTDASLSHLFDFDTIITQDITLYAKWNKSSCISLSLAIPLIFTGTTCIPLLGYLWRRL